MAKKKVLQKNEVRMDLNPKHRNKEGKAHKAYITAKKGHLYKANTLTHAKYIVDKQRTYDLDKNSKKKGKHSRISPPFWQHEKMFGKKVLSKIPKEYKSKVSRFNRKFK